MSLRTMLTQTATIQRKANSVSATTGGVTAGFVNIASGVACAIQSGRDSEAIEFSRRNGRVVYRAYFEPTASLQLKDRFVTLGGTNIEPTAREYDVVSPPNDQAGRGAYLTCLCEFTTREGQV